MDATTLFERLPRWASVVPTAVMVAVAGSFAAGGSLPAALATVSALAAGAVLGWVHRPEFVEHGLGDPASALENLARDRLYGNDDEWLAALADPGRCGPQPVAWMSDPRRASFDWTPWLEGAAEDRSAAPGASEPAEPPRRAPALIAEPWPQAPWRRRGDTEGVAGAAAVGDTTLAPRVLATL